jgi:hypothetical protein
MVVAYFLPGYTWLLFCVLGVICIRQWVLHFIRKGLNFLPWLHLRQPCTLRGTLRRRQSQGTTGLWKWTQFTFCCLGLAFLHQLPLPHAVLFHVKHSSHMVKMALSQEDRAHTPELHFSRTFQSRTSLSDFMWMSRKKKMCAVPW